MYLFQDNNKYTCALWWHTVVCSFCQHVLPEVCLTACLTCIHSRRTPAQESIRCGTYTQAASIVSMKVAACRHGSGMTARESSSGSLQATPLQILRSQQHSPWGHFHSQELIDLNTAQRELIDGDDAEGEVELLDRRANSMPSLQVRHEGRCLQSLVLLSGGCKM